MAICLRLIQRFEASQRNVFLEIEREFIALEESGALPRGERLLALAAKEPSNTLIWQRRFDTLGEAEAALQVMNDHPAHIRLYDLQSPFIRDSWVEFYSVLDGDAPDADNTEAK